MTADQKLKKIARIFERRYKSKEGLNITTHLYYNMAGAMIDLKRKKKADRVIMHTLNDVHSRIAKIGKLLDLD